MWSSQCNRMKKRYLRGSGHSRTWFLRDEGQGSKKGKSQPCLGDRLLGRLCKWLCDPGQVY